MFPKHTSNTYVPSHKYTFRLNNQRPTSTQLLSDTMSSAEAQVVYNRKASLSEPMEAQEGFAQQFDLSRPAKAMDEYQRYATLFPPFHLVQ
jgi:hypothetical protein